MTARMVNAIPAVNTNLPGFGFGAMCPLLAPRSLPGFIGDKRVRCVTYFTLRIIIILMETIKDLYISVGHVPLDGTLGRGSRLGA